MTLLDLLLLCSSLLGWLMYALSRRRHARELRRLAIERGQHEYHGFWRGRWSGIRYDTRRRRTALDWQEATRC